MIAQAHRAGRCARLALPLLLALCLSALAQGPTSGLQPIPPLKARVTDLTGTLTAEQQAALEQKLKAFEAAKGSQIAVLIVSTTAPEDIQQYSFRVADTWKLGRKEFNGKRVDDGVLLAIAKDDRALFIQVGYGLEGVLNDAIANRIYTETLKPAFREGNFYEGINAALDQMMKLIDGEPLPPPEHRWRPADQHPGGSLLPQLFFLVLIGSVVLRGIFGRTFGSVLTGLGAGALVWIAGYTLALALLAAFGGTLLGLLLGLPRGSGWSSYPRSGGFGGGWGGGGFGGGGFGGGGFGGGGFGGGGGGFGGGGAGGRW
jgi:uncharacterized protein